MPFEYYGRDHDTVWTQEITRYYFITEEEVRVQREHTTDQVTVVAVGTRLKVSKREAHTYFTKGYVEYRARSWNAATRRYEYMPFYLTKGEMHKDVETRVLKQYPVRPEDVAPPKRKKKK